MNGQCFFSLRVPTNCRRDFSLLAFDPDGDEVKCRYGNAALSECNTCTPPTVLSLSSVSSNCALNDTFYMSGTETRARMQWLYTHNPGGSVKSTSF